MCAAEMEESSKLLAGVNNALAKRTTRVVGSIFRDFRKVWERPEGQRNINFLSEREKSTTWLMMLVAPVLEYLFAK